MKSNCRVFMIIFTVSVITILPKPVIVEALPDESLINVSMDFQNANLKDVLKVLSIQSGFNFIASEAIQDRKITLFLDKVPVKEAVDKLFKANNLSYDLYEDANIIIVKEWGKPQLDTITKVFTLKHASVSSSSLIKEMAQIGGSGSSGSSSGKAGTGITSIIEKILSSGGSVLEDSRTNSLVVTDIPNRMPLIERTIVLLDVPTPQVLIEVEMLDVSKNVVDKLGFEYSQTPFTVVLSGATKTAGFPFSDWTKTFANASSLGTLAVNTTNKAGESAVYQVLLDFLNTQTDAKYLARPRLLTLNNETAEISITKDEVVGKKETASTSAAGTTTSTEYIRSTDLSLTPEGVGIYLRVTPQVNPETNEITMVINPKSSITTTSALATTQADAEVRSTKSIVKVKDGETIVVGGLIHTDKQVSAKKLPFLGDIPILGVLFRNKNQSKDLERELLIFITPRIIKDSNVELAQAKPQTLVFPEREQSSDTGIDRQALINSSLDNIEQWK